MIISITGTPGTGKTTLAEKLSDELSFRLVKLNEYVKENDLILGYDEKRDSKIVDIERLKGVKFEDNTLIEGHLSQYVNSDIIIVLRCNPEELYERLKKRKYTEEKIRENLESECLGLIIAESLSRNKNVYELDTTNKTVSDVLQEAMEIVEGKRNKYKPKINYLEKVTELDNIIKR